jgi:hypothetical protein
MRGIRGDSVEKGNGRMRGVYGFRGDGEREGRQRERDRLLRRGMGMGGG